MIQQMRSPILQELEARVAKLPQDELEAFSTWFEEFLADAGGRQFEADVLAGRLDRASAQAAEDYKAGRCAPL